jgi:hypothetical protein
LYPSGFSQNWPERQAECERHDPVGGDGGGAVDGALL